MYGIEVAGKPPSELFDRKDGEIALRDARYVHEIAEKFIREFFGESKALSDERP